MNAILKQIDVSDRRGAAAIDQERVAPAAGLKAAADRIQVVVDAYWARAGK